MEWLVEGVAKVPIWDTLWGSVSFLHNPTKGVVLFSPIARIDEIANQGVALLTKAPSDPLVKFRLPIPAALGSARLEVQLLMGMLLPSGNTVRARCVAL